MSTTAEWIVLYESPDGLAAANGIFINGREIAPDGAKKKTKKTAKSAAKNVIPFLAKKTGGGNGKSPHAGKDRAKLFAGEKELAQKIWSGNGDGRRPLTKGKRDSLIITYLVLVKYVATRLAKRLPAHILTDDLESAGVLGLMDAIEKFSPSKGTIFKTYAELRIRGAMLDELREQDWVSRSTRKHIKRLGDARRRLEKELNRPAEEEELANALNLDMEAFYHLCEEAKDVAFLDVNMIKRRMPDASDDDLFDLIVDGNGNNPFDLYCRTEIKDILAKAIAELPQKERQVVELYYYHNLSMWEIGEIVGYTESRISQIHAKAMSELKRSLEEQCRPASQSAREAFMV